MTPRLFKFVSGLSFILCLGTVILWAGSYYDHEYVVIRTRGTVPHTWQPIPKVSAYGGGGGFGFGDGGFGPRPRKAPTPEPVPDQSFFYFGSSLSHSLWLIWSEGWWRSGGHLDWRHGLSFNRLMLYDDEFLGLFYGPGITSRKKGAIVMLEEDRSLTGAHVVAVQVPLRWIVWATSVLPVLWISIFLRAWRKNRRRARAGRCARCRYDLTGNVSGICPECGSRIARMHRMALI